MGKVRRYEYYVAFVILCLAMCYMFGNRTTVKAQKYYSLKEIGLSGCTEDDVDYGILSIKGNTMRYVIYKYSSETKRWLRVGGTKTAKLTSKTKYYMGNADQISSTVKNTGKPVTKTKKKKQSCEIKQQKKNGKRNLMKKTGNINTEKWISRTYKGKVKKRMHVTNNEIQVSKGRATKVLVGIDYE